MKQEAEKNTLIVEAEAVKKGVAEHYRKQFRRREMKLENFSKE